MPQTKNERAESPLRPDAQMQAREVIQNLQPQLEQLISQIPEYHSVKSTGMENSSQDLIPGSLEQAGSSIPSRIKRVRFEATPTDTCRDASPEGKPDRCKGRQILFTGKLKGMDHKTSIETAEKYGVNVPAKVEDADLVVQGTSLEKTMLSMIENLKLESIKEEDFMELIKEGVPDHKDGSEASTKKVLAETAKTTAAKEGSM